DFADARACLGRASYSAFTPYFEINIKQAQPLFHRQAHRLPARSNTRHDFIRRHSLTFKEDVGNIRLGICQLFRLRQDTVSRKCVLPIHYPKHDVAGKAPVQVKSSAIKISAFIVSLELAKALHDCADRRDQHLSLPAAVWESPSGTESPKSIVCIAEGAERIQHDKSLGACWIERRGWRLAPGR